jgi:quinol monooxygenase YgiN
MARVALIVEYHLKPGAVREFDPIIRAHAAGTLADDPGCELFDVLQPTIDGKPDETRMFVYEVYTDRDAYARHTKSPRLTSTRAAYVHLVEKRVTSICDL